MKLDELLQQEGTYVWLDLVPAAQELLVAWMAENNLGHVDTSKLHLSVLYSRKTIKIFDHGDEHHGTPIGFAIFDGALVLKVDAPSVVKRHEQLIRQGGTHDFDSFEPHVTLCYDLPPGFKVADLNPIAFGLSFHREQSEPLKL